MEQVLAAIRAALGAVGAGSGPRLLAFDVDGPGDPIEALATRMFIDHQLDENGLRAIDAEASRRAAAAKH